MASGGRIHFFCPTLRNDIAIQTDQNLTLRPKYDPHIDIYQILHDSCQNSILEQIPPAIPTSINISFVRNMRTKTAFLVANLTDHRFDQLTPPKQFKMKNSQYQTGANDFPLSSFKLELQNNDFILSDLSNQTIKRFSYNEFANVIFKSIQNGIISIFFLSTIGMTLESAIKFENGCCICDIYDFRFDQPIYQRIKLHICNEILTSFIHSQLFSPKKNPVLNRFNKSKKNITPQQISEMSISEKDEVKHTVEQQLILKLHPFVCIDPSPNVCRAMSIMDFRSKLWNDKSVIQLIDKKSNFNVPVKKSTSKLIQVPQISNQMRSYESSIEIPANIVDFFEQKAKV